MPSVSNGKRFSSESQTADSGRTLTYGSMLFGSTAIVPVAVSITLVLAALANPIQPLADSRVSVGDPMLLLRLTVAGLAWLIGLWGVLNSPKVRSVFKSLPGAAVLLVAVLLLLTSVFATEETLMISRASALILLGYVMFMATAVATVGVRSVVVAFLIGSAMYLGIAWAAFLFVPSFGQFFEYTDATTAVMRMGGVAHPNTIAREAAVALVVCLAMIRSRRVGGTREGVKRTASSNRLHERIQLRHVGWVLLVGLILATLVATLSRTSVLAAIAGVIMLMFDKLYSRRGALVIVVVAIFALAGFFYIALTSTESVGDAATAALTKSGDVQELTSLTGRTDIWAEALSLIAERPLTGYGLDSAASVMSEESVGTHNLMLHVLFSGGVLVGLVMFVLVVMTTYIALASRQPLFRGIATYVLVSGLVEDTLFGSFPCPLTLLWIVVLMATALPEPDQTLEREPSL